MQVPDAQVTKDFQSSRGLTGGNLAAGARVWDWRSTGDADTHSQKDRLSVMGWSPFLRK